MNDPAHTSRRKLLLGGLAASTVSIALPTFAQSGSIWSAAQAHEALVADLIRLVDVRSREEWMQTGVAEGAWAISLHEPRFNSRILAARALADDRPLAVICAVGGRSNAVLTRLQAAGYGGTIDVSEGMMGSARGPGWIAGGFPVVSLDVALQALPEDIS